MGHHPFKLLRDKMPPDVQARATARATEMMAEMAFVELRKHVDDSQEEELAAKLGIRQPSLSKLESQDDMQITTLSRLIEALGGKLEIIAHMPLDDIHLTQFKETS